MDTAAVMCNLDLVVTSDTAAAHLAGGLGVPVWLALAAAPEWRWMHESQRQPLVSDDAAVSAADAGRLVQRVCRDENRAATTASRSARRTR